MTSQEVIDVLEANGWVLDRIRGSHHIYRNLSRSKHVTVPHPRKDMRIGTIKSIERQSRLKLKY